MKIFLIMALTLFMSGCANAQSTSTPVKLDVVGETLPAIRHINEMKMSGDTLSLSMRARTVMVSACSVVLSLILKDISSELALIWESAKTATSYLICLILTSQIMAQAV